uniref:U2-theraphotoxin-Bs1a n=1 Tax=Brachypelma smithi TaxID=54074 RepID=TXP5_BRASM|nr:RecName: Full=U2-theraphotoxin-Bs1a; Short=U2-TRTX-Bs1a; AltName: Full=BsTX5; AltName: Full=TXP5; AltName: Full=Venom protein 5 [Brachypelma smithi]AAB32862.1 Protein 5=toxin Tx2-9 homolog [Brachypelma smithii=Mexican red knee tarantula, venom, Peptide, 34 aa] [Brachypelma smithi]
SCVDFQTKCKKDSDCCGKLECSSRWKWCVYPSPF